MTDDQLPFDYDPSDPRELAIDAERAQAKRDPAYVLRDDMKGLQWVRRWREQLHATQVLVRGQPHTCQMRGCGRLAQLHHVFDRAAFGSEIAEAGPMVWLCQEHHTLLHQGHENYYRANFRLEAR
jgi:hypothetical protein